ncbi:hypothetical protein IGI39_004045 [Enterococcus sp. AZ135]|uniref:hypothetical protein n=1 Tax=unclassified Enterococcus TaxID=2608891 RepID=UPI003F24E49B
MAKEKKEMKVILKNRDGTICEDISKKEWSSELRQQVSERMGDIILRRLERENNPQTEQKLNPNKGGIT